jgi:ribosome-associated protein
MPRKARPDDAPDAPSGRPDRNLHREHMQDLTDLANRLAKLPPRALRDLPLDDDVREQLDLLAKAGPGPHRRRILMRAKLFLGGADLERLEAALAGETPAALLTAEMVRWRERLVTGGDAELQAFVEAYPRADRQSLRASLREARGTGPAATRAQSRLLTLLREAAAE